MKPQEVMREVRALIRFYDRRRKNWLLAAEFTLARHTSDSKQEKRKGAKL